jgi:hypothetical protein
LEDLTIIQRHFLMYLSMNGVGDSKENDPTHF